MAGFELLAEIAKEQRQAERDALLEGLRQHAEHLRRGPNRDREGVPAELWRSLT